MMPRFAAAALLGIVLALSGWSHPSAAQQAPAAPSPAEPAGDAAQEAQDPPVFRGRIDLVRVDVMVTDRDGRPVTDLTEADFEVLEEGQRQTIEQFRRVDLTSAAGTRAPAIRTAIDEEIEAAREDVRLFAFFLDDYHVRSNNAVAVREPLVRFIRTELRPTDMIGVMYPLTPIDEVLFTRDHEAVVRVIQGFRGRKYDYTPTNAFEQNYVRASTQDIERIRNAVVIDALTALSTRMGGLREGRKAIVFVSEGFTTLLPVQMRRRAGEALGIPDARLAGPEIGIDEELATIASETDLYRRMREVYIAAARYNAAVYALDPRGTAAFEFDASDAPGMGAPSLEADRRALRSTQDTLRTLAEETHGRAIVNRNALDEGLTQMLLDSSAYYLLGYATSAPADGRFHRITVRVQRRGAEVRARRGFWAASEADMQRATSAPAAPEVAGPVQQALASIASAPRAERYVRTWVGVEPGDQGRTRVRLVWEPMPVVPGDRREPVSQVTLTASTGNGDEVFQGPVPEGAAAAVSGPQQVMFDVPPGRVDLRLSIHGGGSTLDEELRTIEAPDLTTPEVRLSTPRVHRARTARDIQNLNADPGAVPVAAREFSRTERLLIRFDVQGPGAERPEPAAALLNRNGQKMADLPVAPAQAGGTHQIDFGLNSVPAGEYLVEITVPAGSGTVSELVAFRIGS